MKAKYSFKNSLIPSFFTAGSIIAKLSFLLQKDRAKPNKHLQRSKFRTTIITTSILSLILFSAAANSAGKIDRAFQVSTQEKVNTPHAKNTLLIKFKTGSTINRVTAICALSKGKRSKPKAIPGLKVKSLAIPGVNKVVAENQWQKITYPAGVNLATVIDQLSKVAEVEYVQPDYIYTMSSAPPLVPNDPMYPLTNPNNVTFPNLDLLWGVKRTNAPHVWSKLAGKTEVVVAVIDSGIDLNHEDLKDNLWINPIASAPDQHGYDFLNGDGVPDDEHGHGTHVAGTIAAKENNSVGVAGVARNVKIMALKVFGRSGGAPTSGFIDAIKYADAHGVQISNNSWGGPVFDLVLYETMQKSSALFLVAAGNNNYDNDRGDLAYPNGGVGYPATFDLPNIISVAATDPDDFGSGFSNWGLSSVDIGAPGQYIWSTAMSAIGCVVCSSSEYPGYYEARGTSMATPHVTGAAAMLYSLYSGMTPAIAKTLLLQSANTLTSDPLNPLGLLILTGLLDIDKAVNSSFLLSSDATEKTMTSPGIVQFTINAQSFNGASGSLNLSLNSREDYITGSINKSALSIAANGQDSAIVSLNLASGYPLRKAKVEVTAENPATGLSYNVSLVVDATVDTDLVVTSVSAIPAPARVNNGDYLDVTSTIKNQGTVPVPDGQQFAIAYYLSPDKHISTWDPKLSGTSNVVRYFEIEPGQSITLTSRVKIPYVSGGLPVGKGTWYLGAVVDINAAIIETDDTNNYAVAPDQITIVRESDLIVTSVTTATPDLQPGDRFDVTTTIKNIGVTGANDVCWGVYVSDDATIDPLVDKGINSTGRICVNGTYNYIAAGASYTRTTQVQIPFDQPEKSYYLGGYVDAYNDVPEKNPDNTAETNNGYALSKINVGNVTTPVNGAPTANISGPTTGNVDDLLSFSGSGSTDPDGDTLTYSWTFGDGSPASTAASVSHAYTTSGTFTVTLTVSDSALSSTVTQSVTISAPVDLPPTAVLSGPGTGNVGDGLIYNGSGSSDTEGPISAYTWTFGDGSTVVTGTASSASHTYTSAGTYSVVLTVRDSAGQTATASKSVTISSVTTPPPSGGSFVQIQDLYNPGDVINRADDYLKAFWVGPEPPVGTYLVLYSSSDPTRQYSSLPTRYGTYNAATNTWSMHLYVPYNMPLGSAFVKFKLAGEDPFGTSDSFTFQVYPSKNE